MAQALTPGIALTAIIFYNSGLQNRFVYITGRLRELNREARQLRGEGAAKHAPRIASLRWQVALMEKRANIIRRAILTLYGGFLSFVATILLLAAGAWTEVNALRSAPFATFSLGFLCLMGAALFSIVEMYLGQRTVLEDIRTSYDGDVGDDEATPASTPQVD